MSAELVPSLASQEIQQDDSETSETNEEDIKVEGSVFKSTSSGRDETLPPKITSEKEVLHEGVTKQIIKEGHGEPPSKQATCFLHYRAWTEMTMHKFDDTFQEQQPMELVLGHEKTTHRGLAICVASMKAGESALCHVGWQLAYGEEGNFSFPNVPPKADLIYEIEVIGFENAKEGKPRSQMTVEERIEAADRRKADGNQSFKANKLEEAIQQYEMALAYMNDEFMFQLFGKYKDMANAVKNPCHLNMAACMLKLDRYDDVIAQCSVVLQEDEKNVKALFRRGKARAALGRTDEAREDFKKVQKLTPGDTAVIKELALLAKEDKLLYVKQQEMYRGLFGPPPVATPKKWLWYHMMWDWLVTRIRSLFRFYNRKGD